MQLEIWSDVVCPWCAIGRANLQVALADHPRRDQVEVRWRSFQLDPAAPPAYDEPYVQRLATKYRTSEDEARAMMARVERAGAAAGVEFDFAAARSGNTVDAHRVLHLAHERGVQDRVKARLLAGVLSEGLPVSDHAALAAAAAEAGLDRDEVSEVLAGDAYADAVRADVEVALELGISGVPFFVLDRRTGVSGAQPPQVLRGAIDQALASVGPLTTVAGDDDDRDHDPGDACGVDGCTL